MKLRKKTLSLVMVILLFSQLELQVVAFSDTSNDDTTQEICAEESVETDPSDDPEGDILDSSDEEQYIFEIEDENIDDTKSLDNTIQDTESNLPEQTDSLEAETDDTDENIIASSTGPLAESYYITGNPGIGPCNSIVSYLNSAGIIPCYFTTERHIRCAVRCRMMLCLRYGAMPRLAKCTVIVAHI